MKTMRTYFIGLACLLLAACAANKPAPVIERVPASKKLDTAKKPVQAQPATNASEIAKEKDWRPEIYTVKKGDTLHAIGLEYGYDYKEIAQANNIDPPYTIHPGQQLRIRQSDNKVTKDANNGKAGAALDVVITPLKIEPGPQPAGAQPANPQVGSPVVSGVIPFLKEPKALREPYSEQALAAASAPKPADAAAAKVSAISKSDLLKPDATKPADAAKPDNTDNGSGDDDENIDWAWPANGKVLAGFNDAASAKGIDIAGTQGQAVLAAAPGKVIYSGSDLRGYGKLVIIKHNKTYLSVYAHNSQILVKEGQQVTKGQKIAEMGNSDTDSVKLHFEIRRQGKSVDPVKYLAASQ